MAASRAAQLRRGDHRPAVSAGGVVRRGSRSRSAVGERGRGARGPDETQCGGTRSPVQSRSCTSASALTWSRYRTSPWSSTATPASSPNVSTRPARIGAGEGDEAVVLAGRRQLGDQRPEAIAATVLARRRPPHAASPAAATPCSSGARRVGDLRDAGVATGEAAQDGDRPLDGLHVGHRQDLVSADGRFSAATAHQCRQPPVVAGPPVTAGVDEAGTDGGGSPDSQAVHVSS